MKIQLDNEITIDSQDEDEKELRQDLVTIQVKGKATTVKIDTMIKALEVMKIR